MQEDRIEFLHFCESKCHFECSSCQNATTMTVTRLVDGAPIIICQDCYGLVAEIDRENHRSPIDPTLSCLFCSRVGARFNPDLQAAVCDPCIRMNESLLFQAEDAYIPTACEPNQVSPGLFIGPKDSAWDLDILRRLGISRIIVCCSNLRAYHHKSGNKDSITDPSIQYHRLPLHDSTVQELAKYLPSARSFIAQGLLRGENCLVHCNAGVSRSGSIVLDWILQTSKAGCGELPRECTVGDALMKARESRPIITPNSNFIAQLKILYEETP